MTTLSNQNTKPLRTRVFGLLFVFFLDRDEGYPFRDYIGCPDILLESRAFFFEIDFDGSCGETAFNSEH